MNKYSKRNANLNIQYTQFTPAFRTRQSMHQLVHINRFWQVHMHHGPAIFPGS